MPRASEKTSDSQESSLESLHVSGHGSADDSAHESGVNETQALGMWTFLTTELLLFGGLFLAYTVYRSGYPEEFTQAASRLDVKIGTLNTAILLTSSYFMARAVHAVHRAQGSRKSMALNLAATGVLGVAFLVLKGFEYAGDFSKHLTPTSLSLPPPQRLFYFLYYVMTGIHALHLTIGLAAIAVITQRTLKSTYSPSHFAPLELTGLYWHFVDLVWIFLYPLLYLLGRH